MPVLGYPQTTDHVRTGQRRGASLHGSFGISPQGESTQDDLAQDGWESEEVELSSDHPIADGIGPVLGSLGVRQDTFHVLRNLHSRASMREGRLYPATDARFTNAYNPHSGAIVAMDNMSPTKRAIQRHLPFDRLPVFKHWSDVVWLEWTRLCRAASVSPSTLRLVVRYQILNKITLDAIAAMLTERHVKLLPWPGITLYADCDVDQRAVGKLMATPLGHGVAMLLKEHRKDLGSKHVLAITLFSIGTSKPEETCLVFHFSRVEKVPTPAA